MAQVLFCSPFISEDSRFQLWLAADLRKADKGKRDHSLQLSFRGGEVEDEAIKRLCLCCLQDCLAGRKDGCFLYFEQTLSQSRSPAVASLCQ